MEKSDFQPIQMGRYEIFWCHSCKIQSIPGSPKYILSCCSNPICKNCIIEWKNELNKCLVCQKPKKAEQEEITLKMKNVSKYGSPGTSQIKSVL